MIELLSHALGLGVLTAAAAWDLRTTEVPDWLSLVGVFGGVFLHAAAALNQGSSQPLLWSLGVGAALSLYGWSMYFLGMWGGADAFATSVLGFSAPYALSGPGLQHPVNLLLNFVIVGFLYTVGFALLKAASDTKISTGTAERIREKKLRISAELAASGGLSALIWAATDLNPLFYLAGLTSLVFLLRLLRTVEDSMSVKKSAADVEQGEVVEEAGRQVKGISREELDSLGDSEVTVKTGVKFVPVFPLTLLVTDLFGGGLSILTLLIS